MRNGIDWPGLPDHIRAALEAIHAGATADSQESLTLEFKEDPAQHLGKERARADFFAKLIDEAMCIANSEAVASLSVV